MIWIWMLIVCISAIILIHTGTIDSNSDLENNIYAIKIVVIIFVLISAPVFLLDFKYDTFKKPLKENIHINYKNGIPQDTTYTYQ